MMYRKKPKLVYARQWLGGNDIVQWGREICHEATFLQLNQFGNHEMLAIITSRYAKDIPSGNYVIVDENGDFETCDVKTFNETYEEIK